MVAETSRSLVHLKLAWSREFQASQAYIVRSHVKNRRKGEVRSGSAVGHETAHQSRRGCWIPMGMKASSHRPGSGVYCSAQHPVSYTEASV